MVIVYPFGIVLDKFAERGISEGWTNQDYNGITDWLTTVYIETKWGTLLIEFCLIIA